MNIRANVASAFFDGFGPGGLFSRLRRPGAPASVFADEGDLDPAAEPQVVSQRLSKPQNGAGRSVPGELAHRVTKA